MLRNLFSHHRQSEVTSSAQWNWVGKSGKEYQYEIHPPSTAEVQAGTEHRA